MYEKCLSENEQKEVNRFVDVCIANLIATRKIEKLIKCENKFVEDTKQYYKNIYKDLTKGD